MAVLQASEVIERLKAASADSAADRRQVLLRTTADEVRAAGLPYTSVYLYMLNGKDLVLEAFPGQSTEHQRIKVEDAVCGTAVAEGKGQNVPDVAARDNYIACNRFTRNELVVLLRKNGEIVGQIDIHRDAVDPFSEEEEAALKKVADALVVLLNLKPPPRFWLKSERGLLVQVSTVGYEDDNVGNFVKDIVERKVRRIQLELPEGPDPPTLTLHITETADALCDDLPLVHILTQPGYGENSAEKPLVAVIKVEQQSKRQRVDSSFQGRPISEEQSSSFVLSDFFLKDSGLIRETRSLFCRSQFWKQFEFLDMVLHSPRPNARHNQNPYYTGWILGSPGTGKSKTTLAFMSTIDRVHWTITWIHIEDDAVFCYQVVDDDIQIRETGGLEWKPEDIERILLEESDVGRHHIVVVDGIRDDYLHRRVRKICVSWLRKNYKQRRLVFVSSMAFRGKPKEDEDSRAGTTEFLVDSWSWDDYIHAVKNEDFFKNIRGRLDSSGCEDCEDFTSREDLLKSKYFFAGGCPRLMFDYTTAEVMDIFEIAVAGVEDLMLYVKKSQGERSKKVTNKLLMGSYDVKRGKRLTSITSKYAATLVAQLEGPEIIKSLTGVLHSYLNASMRGWLVEMWFFASLPREDFTFAVDGEGTTWPKSIFIDFDPRNIRKVPDDAVWWKPIRWNEGGYDAVYVERNRNLVRFVQVTTAERHSLKLQYFKAFMEELKVHMETKTLEIYFLFQDKEGATQIREPKEVSGAGSLKEFSGWEQGREWRNVRKGLFKCPIPYD
ncbi:unnamed protein product [Calypogeia fissa]